jgi:hypothetical protein
MRHNWLSLCGGLEVALGLGELEEILILIHFRACSRIRRGTAIFPLKK